MATFRELLLEASTLGSPNMVRDHLNNLNAGGSGTTFFISGFDVSIDEEGIGVAVEAMDLQVSIEDDISVSIDESDLSSDVDDNLTITVEE